VKPSCFLLKFQLLFKKELYLFFLLNEKKSYWMIYYYVHAYLRENVNCKVLNASLCQVITKLWNWQKLAFYHQAGGRKPWHSVNFVCAHDGFTLADLVTYNNKYNFSNGEDNRDGENHNLSWNCGEVIQKSHDFASLVTCLPVVKFLANDLVMVFSIPTTCHGL
jgi:hypothetical protein